jgi:hypothetical protein
VFSQRHSSDFHRYLIVERRIAGEFDVSDEVFVPGEESYGDLSDCVDGMLGDDGAYVGVGEVEAV